jgi:hypothetical protein
MAIDWDQVARDAVQSAADVLKDAWDKVSVGAEAQIGALIQVSQSIETCAEAKPPTISVAEYDSLKLSQKRALEGVLKAYEAIGIVVAEQAAAAVWGVVESALSTALKAIIP